MSIHDTPGFYIFEEGPESFRRQAAPKNIAKARRTLKKYVERNSPSQADLLDLLARAWARVEELTEAHVELVGRVGAYKVFLMNIAGRVHIEGDTTFPPDIMDMMMRHNAEFDETVALMIQATEYTKGSARKDTAKKGAAARLANDSDGTQAAKTEARKLWEDWRTGITLHKSGAAFARFVVDRLPSIKTTKTVERWATQWRKEAKIRS